VQSIIFRQWFFCAVAIGLVVGLSMLLLLIPAFAIVPIMMLAPAASLMRRQGLSPAFEESTALAKGNRWKILLAAGVWFAATNMMQEATVFLLKAATAVGATLSFPLLIAPVLLVLSAQSIFGACISIAIYTEARRVADVGPVSMQVNDA
jgi:hypothetical protein